MTPRKIAIGIIALVGLLVMLAFSSCSNKWYAKQCAKRFPIKESKKDSTAFIPGAITPIDTPQLAINCDSILRAQKEIAAKSNIQYVPQLIPIPCPPSTHQVDTFYHSETTTKIDSAALYLAHCTIDSLVKQCLKKDKEIFKQSSQIEEQKNTIKEQAKKITKYGLYLLGLLLLIFGSIALKIYLKFKP